MLKRFHIATIVLALAMASLLVAHTPARAASPAPGLAHATFAGGCFWCMEGPFDRVPGVVSTTSGYTGGSVKKPSYEQVSSGATGHAESVDVVYDPAKVTYAQLLDVFWHNVDPVDAGGQFCDRGASYRTAIFAHDAEQKRLAAGGLRPAGDVGARGDAAHPADSTRTGQHGLGEHRLAGRRVAQDSEASQI